LNLQDHFSNDGRSGIFEIECCEIELTLANAMHRLDACNRGCGAPEPLEAKHDLRPGLDVEMVLLYQVVQYFEDLTSVSAGSKSSAFISRTARCEAA
jgi:hypothetical protein